jgi:hypothetical protein
MPLTYRSSSQQGNSSGGALTVTKPTGTVDGDLIVVYTQLETNTNSWTAPVGFDLVRTDTIAATYRTDIWVKRASSEPTSWTWTPATTGVWRVAVAVSYSGHTGSGTFVDVHGGTSATINSGNVSAPSVTTTVANDQLLALYNNFNSEPWSYSSGAATTERADFGGMTIYDVLRVSAGATGTTTLSTTSGTQQITAAHVALFESSAEGGGGPPLYIQTRPRITISRRR